jgi:hypothetical protein
MRRRWPGPSLALLALSLALGCGGAAPTGPAGSSSVTPTAAPTAAIEVHGRGDAEVAALADRLGAAARRHEPEVSALLRRVAEEAGGELAGFEHRLKTRASTIRKIEEALAGNPAWTTADVALGDPLRYTLVVDDAPPGAHVAAIRRALAALEQAGHRVERMKNYWPRGDNYSGINTTLVAPDGMAWELQFHTPASYDLKDRDHARYQRMRETTTPIDERRTLFDELARPWDEVPIPAGVLDAGALHPRGEIIQRPRP